MLLDDYHTWLSDLQQYAAEKFDLQVEAGIEELISYLNDEYCHLGQKIPFADSSVAAHIQEIMSSIKAAWIALDTLTCPDQNDEKFLDYDTERTCFYVSMEAASLVEKDYVQLLRLKFESFVDNLLGTEGFKVDNIVDDEFDIRHTTYLKTNDSNMISVHCTFVRDCHFNESSYESALDTFEGQVLEILHTIIR